MRGEDAMCLGFQSVAGDVSMSVDILDNRMEPGYDGTLRQQSLQLTSH